MGEGEDSQIILTKEIEFLGLFKVIWNAKIINRIKEKSKGITKIYNLEFFFLKIPTDKV